MCEHADVRNIINVIKSGSWIEEVRVAVPYILYQNTLTVSVPQHEREKCMIEWASCNVNEMVLSHRKGSWVETCGMTIYRRKFHKTIGSAFGQNTDTLGKEF